MKELSLQAITLDKVLLPAETSNHVEVFALRLDKIDPVISGNKWFKLRYYIEDAIRKNKKTIVTFGGAWSNHILATAKACQINGLNAIGVIRGEEPATPSSTLTQASKLGMKFKFLSRDDYSQKNLPFNLIDEYLINEGGYGELGARGAATICEHFSPGLFTHVCCAVGTGTMLAGLRNALHNSVNLIGISVMKNNMSLEESTRQLIDDPAKSFRLFHNYHFGGYAKHTAELIAFMNHLYEQSGIPTDFVYTGKLFFGVNDLVMQGFMPKGSKVLVIHSGGLQGNQSLGKGTLIF